MLYFEFDEPGESTGRLLKSEVSSSDIDKSVVIAFQDPTVFEHQRALSCC